MSESMQRQINPFEEAKAKLKMEELRLKKQANDGKIESYRTKVNEGIDRCELDPSMRNEDGSLNLDAETLRNLKMFKMLLRAKDISDKLFMVSESVKIVSDTVSVMAETMNLIDDTLNGVFFAVSPKNYNYKSPFARWKQKIEIKRNFVKFEKRIGHITYLIQRSDELANNMMSVLDNVLLDGSGGKKKKKRASGMGLDKETLALLGRDSNALGGGNPSAGSGTWRP